jgi:hypothetical protein
MEPKQRKPPLGPRPAYDTVLHGKKLKCYDFYPAQTATACALNKAMTEALQGYAKDVCTTPGVVALALVRGAIGHYNITNEKIDPGTRFMGHLAEFMKTGKLLETEAVGNV